MNAWLARAFETLTTFGTPTAFARLENVRHTWIDAHERILQPRQNNVVVLSVETARGILEQRTNDLSERGLSRCLRRLTSRKGRSNTHVAADSRETFRGPIKEDPRSIGADRWLQRADAIYATAQAIGGTRVIYRAAQITTRDVETFVVTPATQCWQRIVRTQAGVSLVAYTGTTLSPSHAHSGAMGGLEVAHVRTEAIQEAAQRALSSLTARPAPDTHAELVLAPEVGALFVSACLCPPLNATKWVTGESRARALWPMDAANHLVRVVDNPLVANAYGSTGFDDQGVRSSAVPLVTAEGLSPLTEARSARTLGMKNHGNARVTDTGITAHISNAEVKPGTTPASQLIAAVTRGFLIEGAHSAWVDAHTWRFALRAARAKEIVRGKLTGRVHHSVVVRGTVPAILSRVQGVSTETARIITGNDIASTCRCPYLLTHGRLSG